jgi:peptide/nickel transport system permease protein
MTVHPSGISRHDAAADQELAEQVAIDEANVGVIVADRPDPTEPPQLGDADTVLELPPVPRFRLSRGRILRTIPFVLILILAIVGPYLTRYAPTVIAGSSSQSPSGQFWFGTDNDGYDVYSRTIDAFRVDVLIGAVAALMASAGGIILGLITGMNETKRGPLGWAARGLSRLIDLVQSVPAIIVALVLAALYGSSQFSLTAIMAVILVPLQARLVRTEVMKVRGDAYIDAARMSGQSELGLTVFNVLPNSSWPAFEYAPLLFGGALLLTTSLGFLGVGIQMPNAEWGSMIASGASDAASGRWWGFFFPGLALCLCVASSAILFSGSRRRNA